jgi:hypothetical protein
MTFDSTGTILYGTAYLGGQGYGVVFKMALQ